MRAILDERTLKVLAVVLAVAILRPILMQALRGDLHEDGRPSYDPTQAKKSPVLAKRLPDQGVVSGKKAAAAKVFLTVVIQVYLHPMLVSLFDQHLPGAPYLQSQEALRKSLRDQGVAGEVWCVVVLRSYFEDGTYRDTPTVRKPTEEAKYLFEEFRAIVTNALDGDPAGSSPAYLADTHFYAIPRELLDRPRLEAVHELTEFRKRLPEIIRAR